MFGSGNIIARFRGPWGVPIEIDASLFLLVGIIGFLGGDPIFGLIFAAIIVISILLHELGHAWGNIVQGLGVQRVLLYGGGGLCFGGRTGTPQQQELVVAMGPIVNLTLWAVLSLAAPSFTGMVGFWISVAAWVNMALFVLNMVPVQPLDGGKLFQLGMMRIMSHRRAQWVAGLVGFVFSVLWYPAMFWLYFQFGMLLFFFPSIIYHLRMMQDA